MASRPGIQRSDDTAVISTDPVTEVGDGRHTLLLGAPPYLLEPERCLAEVTTRQVLRPTRRIRIGATDGMLVLPALDITPELYIEFTRAEVESRPWPRRRSGSGGAGGTVTLHGVHLERVRRDVVTVRGELTMEGIPARPFRGALRIVESSTDHVLIAMVARAERVQGPPAGTVPSSLPELMYGPGMRIEIAAAFSR